LVGTDNLWPLTGMLNQAPAIGCLPQPKTFSFERLYRRLAKLPGRHPGHRNEGSVEICEVGIPGAQRDFAKRALGRRQEVARPPHFSASIREELDRVLSKERRLHRFLWHYGWP